MTNENTSKETNDDARKDLPAKLLGVSDRHWRTSFIDTKEDGRSFRKTLRDDDGYECKDENARDDGSLVQGKEKLVLGGSILGTNGEVASDGSKNSGSCNPEGKHNEGGIAVSESSGGNDGANEGLKEIGTHTGDVTNLARQ